MSDSGDNDNQYTLVNIATYASSNNSKSIMKSIITLNW